MRLKELRKLFNCWMFYESNTYSYTHRLPRRTGHRNQNFLKKTHDFETVTKKMILSISSTVPNKSIDTNIVVMHFILYIVLIL